MPISRNSKTFHLERFPQGRKTKVPATKERQVAIIRIYFLTRRNKACYLEQNYLKVKIARDRSRQYLILKIRPY